MECLKLAIIGSGPAGLTAAIYAARGQLKPVIFEGPEPGGQLMWTTEVENFPGFPEGIMGPELMSAMRQQAIKFGSVVHSQTVSAVDFSQTPYSITTDKQTFNASSVIISTGASARWLGLPNEQRLRGKGVSACATCDGFFFRGKDVVVVGGGDSAMEEATFLSRLAKHVTLIVREPDLMASLVMAQRVRENPNVEIIYNSELADVIGQDSVTGIKVLIGPEHVTKDIACQGVFIAIGHRPNTDLFKNQLEINQAGYLVVRDQVMSSKTGIFIAGDVSDARYRQAITAAGWGCMAALEAERFLQARPIF